MNWSIANFYVMFIVRTYLKRSGHTGRLVNALEYLAVHAHAQRLRQDRVVVCDRVLLR